MKKRGVVYRAVVQNIIPHGKHGPYAVATSGKLSFTFSLNTPTWDEENWPREGTHVVLTQTSRMTAGWRADRARLLQPSDEQ